MKHFLKKLYTLSTNALKLCREDILIGFIYIVGNIIIFSFSFSYIDKDAQLLINLYLLYFSLYYILLFLYNITISIKIFNIDIQSGILDILYIETSSRFIVLYKFIMNLLLLNLIHLSSYPFLFFFYNISLPTLSLFIYLILVNNLYLLSIILLNFLVLIMLSIQNINNIIAYAVSIPLYFPLLIAISNMCISILEGNIYIELLYFFIIYIIFFIGIIFYLSNLLVQSD